MEGAAAELKAGSRVLGYSILGLLAQGGMAEVYLARKLGAPRDAPLLVVKRIRPTLLDDPQFVQMFGDEARLAQMLNHPNVVRVMEVGQDGQNYALVMEFLDGRNLLRVARACYQRRAYVPYELMGRIVADSLAGLEHAHNQKGPKGEPLNLVHRDMSPENIVITYGGVVKVVDFGIAKAANMEGRTQVGVIKGKLGYVAPEAISGEKLDGRADIFAMGVTLYELLTYTVPFAGNNEMEILTAVSTRDPPPPRTLNPSVPATLEDICLKALEKNRNRRWQSAGEMRRALEDYVRSTGKGAGSQHLGAFMDALFPKTTDKDRLRVADLIRAADEGAPAGEAAARAPGSGRGTGGASVVPSGKVAPPGKAPPPAAKRGTTGEQRAVPKPRNLVEESASDFEKVTTRPSGPAWSKMVQVEAMMDGPPGQVSIPPTERGAAKGAVLSKRAPAERPDSTEVVPSPVPPQGGRVVTLADANAQATEAIELNSAELAAIHSNSAEDVGEDQVMMAEGGDPTMSERALPSLSPPPAGPTLDGGDDLDLVELSEVSAISVQSALAQAEALEASDDTGDEPAPPPPPPPPPPARAKPPSAPSLPAAPPPRPLPPPPVAQLEDLDLGPELPAEPEPPAPPPRREVPPPHRAATTLVRPPPEVEEAPPPTVGMGRMKATLLGMLTAAVIFMAVTFGLVATGRIKLPERKGAPAATELKPAPADDATAHR
ncbi:MAG: serine/threonine-protein kinase [Myxococcota bacterium]